MKRVFVRIRRIILCLSLSFCCQFLNAQDNRIVEIEQQLEAMYQKGVVELKDEVDLSFSSISIQEFIRALGKSTGLNLTIDPTIKLTLSNNFVAEEPQNIILYLCKTHDLDIETIGSIITFKKYKKPKVEIAPLPSKPLLVSYDRISNTITFDLKKDSLDSVVKKIAQLSGKNIVLSPNTQGRLVSVYLEKEPFEDALSKLAFANNLEFINEDGAYYFKQNANTRNNNSNNNNSSSSTNGKPKERNKHLAVYSRKDTSSNEYLISIEGTNIPIRDIIQDVSDELNNDYFIYSDIKGNLTLHLKNIGYEELLNFIFLGTNYTFKNEGQVYLLGERSLEQIRSNEVIKINHRSVEDMMELIPAELQRDVEVKAFNDLNSIIISGSRPKIEEFKLFISEIDKRVPMLYLELLIIDFRRGRSVNTGITAGIADTTVKTAGTLLPGVDMTFSSGSINNFLSFLSDKGILNLGQVTPNFYVGIQALEQQDRVDIRSTPKLSTLNGQTASLSIGETVYYRVTQSNIIGTQNPQTVVTEEFREAEANMNIEITPFISGDENVTITIDVELSNFQGVPASNAPPNRFTRQFSSEIRAQNNDLIVLGGLEQSSKASGGQGLPGVSRVPVLKWLFGKRSKSKSSSQLVVFIKPTIVY